MPTLTDARERAIDGIRRYVSETGPQRTVAAKQVAAAFVDARTEHFFTREGEPDVLGRTNEYREWVRETMDLAGATGKDRTSILSNIRHHVSVLLHANHAESLAAQGANPEPPLERIQRLRARDNRIRAVFSGGRAITDMDDALLVAARARRAFDRIRELDTESDAELVREALHAAAQAAKDAAERI